MPSSCPNPGKNEKCGDRFTDSGRAALRLGHNYVGTEHLLLGILLADGDAARALTGLGLTAERAEQALAAEFAAI